jgi:inner membrane protein involved in colicin E2 resistance
MSMAELVPVVVEDRLPPPAASWDPCVLARTLYARLTTPEPNSKRLHVCIYIYICIHIYIYISIYIAIHIHTYTNIYTCMHIFVFEALKCVVAHVVQCYKS